MTCPDCRRHKDEILRLRNIINEQDRRHLQGLQRRNEFAQQMEHHLTRLRESQQLLANELTAGRR